MYRLLYGYKIACIWEESKHIGFYDLGWYINIIITISTKTLQLNYETQLQIIEVCSTIISDY